MDPNKNIETDDIGDQHNITQETQGNVYVGQQDTPQQIKSSVKPQLYYLGVFMILAGICGLLYDIYVFFSWGAFVIFAMIAMIYIWAPVLIVSLLLLSVGSYLAINNKNHAKHSKRLFYGASLVIIIFGLIALSVSLGIFTTKQVKDQHDITHKTTSLDKSSQKLADELNSITIVSGVNNNAKGVVDGDWLTADSDPNKSTFAKAQITANQKLNALESQVYKNLATNGFIREGDPAQPYYNFGLSYGNTMSEVTGSTISFRYINSQKDQAIKIYYILDKAYQCPQGYVCNRNKNTKPTDNVYNVAGFGDINVASMDVRLAQQDNYQVHPD